MEAAAAHILDLTQDLDITLVDQIIQIAYEGTHPKQKAMSEFMVMLIEHPEMWKRADTILEKSTLLLTRFFGLQVLKQAIECRWQIIPADQREGIRNYIVTKIIAVSSNEESMRREAQILSRLNLILVQVLKQDWPHNWPTFIGDIVGSSKTSETLCENNMEILKLLSEEVFDFSKVIFIYIYIHITCIYLFLNQLFYF